MHPSQTAPFFEEPIHNTECKEGQSVTLRCRVAGHPPPQISWLKDGVRLENCPDFVITTEGDRSSLRIPEAFDEDSGKYTVVAANPAGTSRCAAKIFVLPHSPTEIRVQTKTFENRNRKQPPEFTQLFQDRRVQVGRFAFSRE